MRWLCLQGSRLLAPCVRPLLSVLGAGRTFSMKREGSGRGGTCSRLGFAPAPMRMAPQQPLTLRLFHHLCRTDVALVESR